jgi:hypothetical protein
VAQALRKGAASTKKYMKHDTLSAEGFESTYALLVRSEEKERGMFESAAYLIVILSAVFSIWNAAQQSGELPLGEVKHTTSVASFTAANHA